MAETDDDNSESALGAGKVSSKKDSYLLTRWIFLRMLGVIHLTAFGSYIFQINGLNGSNGILPTKDLVADFTGAPALVLWQNYCDLPTLSWFNSSDAFLQGITITGSVLSLFVILGIATAPSLLLLTILWLSLVKGGGEFTGFQSDGMLVEMSFLALLFAPWQFFEPPWPVPYRFRCQTNPPAISLYLIRFMLFRIMFVSGCVKLSSGDPTWRDLTAMQYHYETQPIPTPLAWYAHRLPTLIHKASVLGMYISEIFAPICVFGPRIYRLVGSAVMASLHIMIALTGNYTFLSLLMVTLCITLVDDELLSKFLPKALSNSINESIDESKLHLWRELPYKALTALLTLTAFTIGLSSIGFEVFALPLRPIFKIITPFELANVYGLFAVMTTKRPEIVFEGSYDGKSWQSYEFANKPDDDLKRAPPWVAPHMPRLDWRLWFAGMQPVSDNPWVFALVKRMLEGNVEVEKFFLHNPFSKKAPKYIRAFVYDYHFTDFKQREASGDWWWRDNKRVYLDPVTLNGGMIEPADFNKGKTSNP